MCIRDRSHTLHYQFVHILWPTHNLESFLQKDDVSSILSYFGVIMKNLNGYLIAASGIVNHVHLLVNVPSNISISELGIYVISKHFKKIIGVKSIYRRRR